MKGIEKLTGVRLAEVLSQKNAVPTDVITDALYTQDQLQEPFVEVLVDGGHITEWDLAKLVVEHFQLPFVMASNYDITPEVRDRLPPETVFPNKIVPLDVFGNAVIIAMPILTPYEALDKIRSQHSCDIYPYVGLISENKKVLLELFSGFKEWQAKEAASRDKRRKEKGPKAAGNDWMNIFDSADAAVRDSLGGE